MRATPTSSLRLRLTGGVSAATVAAMLFATPAAAQTAPAADQGAEIVVTGIRASLDSSARIKRNTVTISDSVSAEDIGKLPDVSIADSLARLPGVTAQRLEGRDQRLSIRGLGPDFGTTLLNGREQVTVGDNRGVEYDQYPSEFFKNVVVYKSADAGLVAAGIAGTVDLRMLRPLAQPHRVITVGLRGQMNGEKSLNPDSPRFGYRASATYIDKFANDTFGIALGISATSSPSQDERYEAWGDNNYPQDSANNYTLGGAKPYVQSNVLNRYGAVATLEYQPSDNFHSTLDVLYTKFKETQHLRGIEFPLAWSGATLVSSSASGGYVNSATYSGVHAIQRNDLNVRHADNLSIGWNNIIGIGGSKHLTIDASWSRATRDDFLLENYSGVGYGGSGPGDTVTITRQSNGIFRIVPTLNYADPTLFKITDPGGWGYNGTQPVVQAGFLNAPNFTDDLKALRASLDGEFANAGVLKGWEIGANFSRREKVSAYKSYFLCPKGAGTNCTVASGTPTSMAVPSGAIITPSVTMNYLGVPALLTLNPMYLYQNVYNSFYDNRPVSLVRDNTITENILTAYAKVNIDGTLGDKPLRGSFGVQYVHSNQQSVGAVSNFSGGVVTIIPASARVNYSNILPSFALSVELERNLFVKLGASRTMVRPRLDQERVNQEYSINFANIGRGGGPANSPFSSNGGNTQLRPYLSDNVDLSVEKYFAHSGYVSVSGFFKALDQFIDPSTSFAYDFSSLMSQLSPANQALVTSTGGQIGLVSGPTNSGRGNMLGMEATLSMPFSNLSSSLDGFGFFGSASYTDSSVKYLNRPALTVTLPGLSDWVGNAELYYEKHGFQARVSYRYRSGFLGEVAGLSANPAFFRVKPESIVDAQIGYEFQPGSPLAGLSILLQGKNLTDRPFITYLNNDPNEVKNYQRYGRDFYLGLTYKF